MPLSERAPPLAPVDLSPLMRVDPPGPLSRSLTSRLERVESPAFEARRRTRAERAAVEKGPIVYAEGLGANVLDVDGNRYVDLAAGFGALLLGHRHPRITRALEAQAARLWMALGDLHAADTKVALLERLAALYPKKGARVLLGQSGADAVTAAIKTAKLATGKPGLVAFEGAYHGLGYAPLAACGLRESWRSAFADQLNSHVVFAPYPRNSADAARSLEVVSRALNRGDVGAVLVEPILGRGGCLVPPPGFLTELVRVAERASALVIADEIWTGLGRAGEWLASIDRADSSAPIPHLVCLGKGLGGGLPISACVGPEEVMRCWQREPDEEVVHTATFHGAPLACVTALATLEVLRADRLPERAARMGEDLRARLARAVQVGATRNAAEVPIEIRGAGMMIGIDWGEGALGTRMARRLLERGYIVTTGGEAGAVTILTPPLTLAEPLLESFVETLTGLFDDSHA